MKTKINAKGVTIGELLVAVTISILVVGGVFALWFMAQDTWLNERTKSKILQELQVSIERIKREIQISDGSKIFFHIATDGNYNAISLPLALDDGRSDAGYSASENGDGFIERDSTTTNPITGVSKVYWDKTVIYHIYDNGSEYELRRTDFYPRDNSLSTVQRQNQIDNVVSLGTGNDASVPNYSNWQNTRTIFKGKSVSFEVVPKLRQFDGYSPTTERTENLVDFGSIILDGDYHTIKFKIIGQNANSTGHAFGLDTLKFTPPGSTREGENYTSLTHPDGSSGISSSSGDTISNINVHNSPDGLWSADYYMNYAANAVNDYLVLRFHYDRLCTTTFLDGISENLNIEFSNTDGQGGASGSPEWLAQLEGNGTTWDSATQTKVTVPATLIFSDGGTENITYRNLILGNYTQINGMMLSIKFCAGTNYSLDIASAYIIQRGEDETDSPDDGSSNMPSIPITFDGCDIDSRNTGQAPTPIDTNPGSPGYEGIQIPAGKYAWSNWIQLYDASSVNFNFDKTKDYFVSIYIPDIDPLAGGTPKSISYWQDTSSNPETHSYIKNGQYDGVIKWNGTGTASQSIYGIEQIDVTYMDKGMFNSLVFDTGVVDPVYSTMKWTSIINNPDATLQIKVRSSDDKASLESDGEWTSVPGQILTISSDTGSAALAIGTGRYVQFRAEFTALESYENSSHITHDAEAGDDYDHDEDYDITCVLKDVSIYWPGNTTMVDVGGHFTKRPDYGIITIEIDGQKLTKGFEIKLSIEEDLVRENETVTRSITAEMEPRNTNK